MKVKPGPLVKNQETNSYPVALPKFHLLEELFKQDDENKQNARK
jgi:hypothetical protein